MHINKVRIGTGQANKYKLCGDEGRAGNYLSSRASEMVELRVVDTEFPILGSNEGGISEGLRMKVCLT